jgi:SAM-dependent methyltransferase
MEEQTVQNQKGEIEFRRKLFQQQVEGEKIFDGEFDAEGIESILIERMERTAREMRGLRDRGVVLSPYLEIGAERGQRAMVMENELESEGAAVDLSFDLLRSCAHYARRFGREKLPFRVCADAYRLPFESGSVPFVYCYQTLHHFPDPTPIIAEVHRVLAPGGHFYFSEEPYKKVLHWNLYQAGKRRLTPVSRAQHVFERFFAKPEMTEEEFGIVENHSIAVGTWKRALGMFEEASVTMLVANRVEADLFRPRNPLKWVIAYLLGGGISGLCRKAGAHTPTGRAIRDILISPALLEQGEEVRLRAAGATFTSDRPGDRYPVVDDIAVLMKPELIRQLYPEMLAAE